MKDLCEVDKKRDSALCAAAARFVDQGDVASARRAHDLALRLEERRDFIADRVSPIDAKYRRAERIEELRKLAARGVTPRDMARCIRASLRETYKVLAELGS